MNAEEKILLILQTQIDNYCHKVMNPFVSLAVLNQYVLKRFIDIHRIFSIS